MAEIFSGVDIEPGKSNQPLINPEFPSYNFDVIDSVTYKIDLSQPSKYASKGKLNNPEANRIVDLQYDGKPINPEQMFVVATNNCRAGGGGNCPGVSPETTILEAPDTNRDVIVRYIAEQGTINPSADANWTFKELPGTTVIFDTGPGGKDFADSVKGVDMEPDRESADGFARYRIAL